jgi:hypothetical protein
MASWRVFYLYLFLETPRTAGTCIRDESWVRSLPASPMTNQESKVDDKSIIFYVLFFVFVVDPCLEILINFFWKIS